jgi:DNA-binding NarL/FixJ family response regulator
MLLDGTGTATANGERDLRVVVASDDPFSRQAFRQAASVRGIDVLAADSIAAVAEHHAHEHEPDVVVIDVQLPAVEALRALERVRAAAPTARLLAFSAPASTEFGILCIHAGASGYLSKEIDLAALPRVLRSLTRGEAVISREFATFLVEQMRSGRPRGPRGVRSRAVTGPERVVLELIRSGRTPDAVAVELGITVGTVQRHLASTRRKLAASLEQDRSAASQDSKQPSNRARETRAGGSHD